MKTLSEQTLMGTMPDSMKCATKEEVIHQLRRRLHDAEHKGESFAVKYTPEIGSKKVDRIIRVKSGEEFFPEHELAGVRRQRDRARKERDKARANTESSYDEWWDWSSMGGPRLDYVIHKASGQKFIPEHRLTALKGNAQGVSKECIDAIGLFNDSDTAGTAGNVINVYEAMECALNSRQYHKATSKGQAKRLKDLRVKLEDAKMRNAKLCDDRDAWMHERNRAKDEVLRVKKQMRELRKELEDPRMPFIAEGSFEITRYYLNGVELVPLARALKAEGKHKRCQAYADGLRAELRKNKSRHCHAMRRLVDYIQGTDSLWPQETLFSWAKARLEDAEQ